MEAFAIAAVENAVTDPRTGRVFPDPGMVETAVTLYSEYHAKMISHLKDLGGSRHVSVPHPAALEQIGEAFARYYRGSSSSAAGNVSLFELAWDVVGSEWGARQELYERFHFGDAVLRRVGTYLNYDLDEATRMVARALERTGVRR
jgi:4-hydroxyphenylacetate 3-monooxygenase